MLLRFFSLRIDFWSVDSKSQLSMNGIEIIDYQSKARILQDVYHHVVSFPATFNYYNVFYFSQIPGA